MESFIRNREVAPKLYFHVANIENKLKCWKSNCLMMKNVREHFKSSSIWYLRKIHYLLLSWNNKRCRMQIHSPKTSHLCHNNYINFSLHLVSSKSVANYGYKNWFATRCKLSNLLTIRHVFISGFNAISKIIFLEHHKSR